MPGSPPPELEKGFCYHQSCARAVSSCLWAKDGRSRWREGWGGVSAGLVSAGGSAIHTTQMQVDEVTVIRLSPIVYNKELVKIELLSQIPTLAPFNQSNIWERHRNKKKGKQETGSYIWAHTHIYTNTIHLSFSVDIHICTHTHKYITNIYIGKMKRKIPAGRQGLPRGKIKKFTQRHFTYLCLQQYLSLMSPVLAEKSRINPVALELSNMSEGNSVIS